MWVRLDLRPDPAFDEGVYLTGTISSSLGSLPKLTYLDLSDLKNLSGALPEDLGKLKYLQQSGCEDQQAHRIDSVIFWIPHKSRLAELGDNFLTGSIPPSLGNLGPKLNYLYLSGGSLSGSIPASIFHLPNLTYLYLGSNRLSGGIPSDLSPLATLQYFDLSGNKLSGGLPKNIGEQLNQLGLLDVSSNKFSGSIPDSIGLASGIHFLGLNNNEFSGHIPAALAKLKNLVYANLANNRLTGPIPQGAPFSTIGMFDNNPGLCGSPLPACKRKLKL
ncbi:hypothetical protein O6H91_Y261200 [Diphasiastrum complanatum]|nr:hypothetical protein O6H91_Y261200 [Diphasiastrum complanatum]